MSHKRIKLQRENDMSSGVLSIAGSISTFFTINAIGGSNDSITINHAGKAVIVDRASTFGAKPQYVSWAAGSTVVSPGDNGNFIVYIDSDGIVKIGSANDLAKLPAYTTSGINMNNAVQLAGYSITGGTITSGAALLQWWGNNMNRVGALMDALGPINSFGDSITNSIVAGGLNMAIGAGDAISRSVGFKSDLGTQSPDLLPVPSISPTILAFATRDNVVQSFAFNVNVTQYESSLGVLSNIPPNKAANRYFVTFPNNQFSGYHVGKLTYNTTTLAINTTTETANFSQIYAAGVPTIQLAVLVGETNLSNALTKQLQRIL
jgi:hypothetical protein